MKPSQAALQRCSWKEVFWKYAANFLQNTHAVVWSNFIEITLQYGCSHVNFLYKDTCEGLLLEHFQAVKGMNVMSINAKVKSSGSFKKQNLLI